MSEVSLVRKFATFFGCDTSDTDQLVTRLRTCKNRYIFSKTSFPRGGAMHHTAIHRICDVSPPLWNTITIHRFFPSYYLPICPLCSVRVLRAPPSVFTSEWREQSWVLPLALSRRSVSYTLPVGLPDRVLLPGRGPEHLIQGPGGALPPAGGPFGLWHRYSSRPLPADSSPRGKASAGRDGSPLPRSSPPPAGARPRAGVGPLCRPGLAPTRDSDTSGLTLGIAESDG